MRTATHLYRSSQSPTPRHNRRGFLMASGSPWSRRSFSRAAYMLRQNPRIAPSRIRTTAALLPVRPHASGRVIAGPAGSGTRPGTTTPKIMPRADFQPASVGLTRMPTLAHWRQDRRTFEYDRDDAAKGAADPNRRGGYDEPCHGHAPMPWPVPTPRDTRPR